MENQDKRYFETTAAKVRRLLAHELRMDKDLLRDEFLWISEVTREDACWVLANVQRGFGMQLFDDYLNDEQLTTIATVGGLIALVRQKTGQS